MTTGAAVHTSGLQSAMCVHSVELSFSYAVALDVHTDSPESVIYRPVTSQLGVPFDIYTLLFAAAIVIKLKGTIFHSMSHLFF